MDRGILGKSNNHTSHSITYEKGYQNNTVEFYSILVQLLLINDLLVH